MSPENWFVLFAVVFIVSIVSMTWCVFTAMKDSTLSEIRTVKFFIASAVIANLSFLGAGVSGIVWLVLILSK